MINDSLKHNNFTRAEWYAEVMLESLVTSDKQFIWKQLGFDNRQFIQNYKWEILDIFGEKGWKIKNMSSKTFIQAIRSVYYELNEVNLKHGTLKLSMYSEWLSDYECNSFYDNQEYIEIPG